MPRFFIDHQSIEMDRAVIRGREAHHIRHVLRLKKGEVITLFTEKGENLEAEIIEESVRQVVVQIHCKLPSLPSLSHRVILGQAIPKGQKMDHIIRQNTELGIHTIIPLLTERTIPQPQGNKKGNRHARWQRIAREASKQCGRPSTSIIESIESFSDFLKRARKDTVNLLLWEGKPELGLKDILRDRTTSQIIFVLVGPEGGFALKEIEEAKRAGFIPVSLGPCILRTETAGLIAAGILQYELETQENIHA